MTVETRSPTALGTNGWTSGANAYSDNSTDATCAPGKNLTVMGIWKTYGFTIGAGATVSKVEVGIDWWVSTTTSKASMNIEVSWDGGSTWGAHAQSEAITGGHIADGGATVWYDCTADTAWTPTKTNDTNLQVRISGIQGNSSTAVTFHLDYVPVRITYTVIVNTATKLVYNMRNGITKTILYLYNIKNVIKHILLLTYTITGAVITATAILKILYNVRKMVYTDLFYYKSHVINSATGAGTNYQVRIIVNRTTGSDSGENVYVGTTCRSDFADIRFYSSTWAELKYWQESVSGTVGTFWVKIEESLESSPVTIYVGYGDPSKTITTSDGTNTFNFFDHFPGESLDITTNWDVIAGTGYAVTGSELTLSGGVTTVTIRSKAAFTFGLNYDLHARWSPYVVLNKNGGTGFRNTASDIARWYIITNPTPYYEHYQTYNAGALRGDTDSGAPYYEGSYGIWKVARISSSKTIFSNPGANFTDSTADQATTSLNVQLDNNGVWDWIFVKKYADPEPAHGSWGTETPAGGPLTLRFIYNISLATKVTNTVRFIFNTAGKITGVFKLIFHIRRNVNKKYISIDTIDTYGLSCNAVQDGENVYVAYCGLGRDAYAVKFDGRTWSDPVFIGTNNEDGHGGPAILRSNDGKLHVFYGDHDSAIHYATSTNPDDISSWTDTTSKLSGLTSGATTYHMVFKDDNTGRLYHMCRDGSSNLVFKYIYSDDNGDTWNGPVTYMNEDHRVPYFAYSSPYRENETGHTLVNFTFVYTWYTTTSGHHVYYMRYDVHYFKFDLTNQHFYTAGGIDLGTDITPAEADASCIAYDTGEGRCYFTTYVDGPIPNKTPLIVFNWEAGGYLSGDHHYSSVEWNGASWGNYAEIVQGGEFLGNQQGALVTSGTHTYFIVNPIWRDGIGLRVFEYNFTTHSWSENAMFISDTECPGYAIGQHWWNAQMQPQTDKWFMFQAWDESGDFVNPPYAIAAGRADDNGNLYIMGDSAIIRPVYDIGGIAKAIVKILYRLNIATSPITKNPAAEGTNAWTNPDRGRTSNNQYATAAPVKNGNISGIWTTFAITDPGIALTKVWVGVEFHVSTASSIATISTDVSWDGGSSWGVHLWSEANTEQYTTDPNIYRWIEVTSDTAWTWSKLADPNLQVRVIAYRGNSNTAVTFNLDAIAIKVEFPSKVVQKIKEMYNLLAKVTNTRKHIYNISGIITAALSIKLMYKIRNFATASVKPIYMLRNFVSSTNKTMWKIRGFVASSIKHVYNLRGFISSTNKQQYNIRGFISGISKHVYNIKTTVSASTNKVIYNIRKMISGTSRSIWNIRSLISASTFKLIYNIRNFVSGITKPVYHIRATLSAAAVKIQYSVRNVVSVISKDIYNLKNFVSSKRTYIYNIAGKLVASFKAVYNLRNTISATQKYIYNILTYVSVGLSVKLVYNVRNFTSSSIKTIYNIRNYITGMVRTIWNIRGMIAGTFKSIYNIRNKVSASTEKIIYHMRGFVVGFVRLQYRLYSFIATTLRVVYYILGAPRVTLTIKYNVRNMVSQKNKLVYNINKMISLAFISVWNMKNFVAQTRKALYNIRNMVSVSTSKIIYNILTLVSIGISIKLVYNIRSFAKSSVKIIYTMRGYITGTVKTIWNIRNIITSTGTKVLYKIRNSVAISVKELYNIRGLISGKFVSIYNLRGYVSAIKNTIIYNVRGLVSNTRKLQYNLFAYVIRKVTAVYYIVGKPWVQLRILYNDRNFVSQNRLIPYNINKMISSAFKAIWNIKKFATAVVRIQYTIKGFVSSRAIIVYNSFGRLVTSLKVLYNLTGKLGVSIRYIYNIRNTVQTTRIIRYSLFNLIARSNRLIYNIRNSVVSKFVGIWNIRKSVGRTFLASYGILEKIGKSFKALYRLGGGALSILRLRYILRGVDIQESDPYYRLSTELYDYLTGLTVAGQEFAGMKIYRRKPSRLALFFPCMVVESSSLSRGDLFGGEYKEGVSVTIELLFKRDYSITRQLILMKEELARYYRDSLVSALKGFESDTIKIQDKQITGVIFGPSKPNHTLYGARVVMQFTFEGGVDWEL